MRIFRSMASLTEAWASQKSFRPRDGSDDASDGSNFHGQKRTNETHASTTDPENKLYRKAAGREAKLCYMGHVTMENRKGLAVAGRVTEAKWYCGAEGIGIDVGSQSPRSRSPRHGRRGQSL